MRTPPVNTEKRAKYVCDPDASSNPAAVCVYVSFFRGSTASPGYTFQSVIFQQQTSSQRRQLIRSQEKQSLSIML
jgi:hypothetical protein